MSLPDDLAARTTSGVTPEAPHAMEEVTTEDLVAAARSGDREAHAMLFRRFHDEVYRFAARRLGDPFAGQDVAAETFADAFQNLHRFEWRGAPFEAWLYTIARRRVADELRARSRNRKHDTIPEDASTPDPAGDVAQAMDMRALIAKLPDAERDVVELRFMEDLDAEQTARRLGKNAGAVRVAQHRAIQRLRAMMTENSPQ